MGGPGQRKKRVTKSTFERNYGIGGLILMGLLAASGCQKKPAAAAGMGMQAMPVHTVTVTLAPVAESSEYVATIKSRRSTTIAPQVNGALTAILAHSGEQVKAGQVLMTIDSRQQQAAVASLLATERQDKALYDYNSIEVARQQKLFDAGIISRQANQQEQQTYRSSKASYEAAVEARKTQQQLLDYYTIRAPYAGVVGDIPVHVGDFVSTGSSPTVLTTVDENSDLEAYIYVPTERSSQLRMGLDVDLEDNSGNLIEKTNIDFISPQVDSTLQGILVKAAVRPARQALRNGEMIQAHIIWSTQPMAVVPVLAVVRQSGLSFVYVIEETGGRFVAQERAVTLGQTVGNNYSISSGLSAGERVIVSGTQFLVNGMPVRPLSG